jgi:molybdopterin-guanine dinucleotide biosynthesis protein MobB
MIQSTVPTLGFAAFSGTGKTTLLKKLIPILLERGVRVGVVKHTHHDIEMDKPGKDSYELRKAGAQELIIASGKRWILTVEREEEEPELQEVINRLDQTKLDLILVEGFKQEQLPKIELHRPSRNKPLLYPSDANIIALGTDEASTTLGDLPVLDLNHPACFADFICDHICSTPPG